MKKNMRKTAYAEGKVIRAMTSIVLATRIGWGGSFFRTCTKQVSVAQPLFAECVHGLVPPAQLVQATISFGPLDSRLKLVSITPISLILVSTVGWRWVRDRTEVGSPVPSPSPSSIKTLVGLAGVELAVETEVGVPAPWRVAEAVVAVAGAVAPAEVVLAVEVAPGLEEADAAAAAAAVADFSAAIAVWNSLSMVSENILDVRGLASIIPILFRTAGRR